MSPVISRVFRRGISTIIPPKVASPSGLSGAQDAARMQRVVKFYESLPRGGAVEPESRGILGWYKKKYFGKNPSAAPIAHVIIFLIAVGYTQQYYFHLRHHKNNAH